MSNAVLYERRDEIVFILFFVWSRGVYTLNFFISISTLYGRTLLSLIKYNTSKRNERL